MVGTGDQRPPKLQMNSCGGNMDEFPPEDKTGCHCICVYTSTEHAFYYLRTMLGFNVAFTGVPYGTSREE